MNRDTLRFLAENGHSSAAVVLGVLAELIDGDRAEAASWYGMAGDDNPTALLARAALVLTNGALVNLDQEGQEEGIELARRASAAGVGAADWLLGMAEELRAREAKDSLETALSYYKSAAAKRYARANVDIGRLYCEKEAEFYDLELAESILTEAYEQGQYGATTALSEIYSNTDREALAKDILERGVQENDRSAIARMAILYRLGGGGIEKDEQRAIQLDKQSASLRERAII